MRSSVRSPVPADVVGSRKELCPSPKRRGALLGCVLFALRSAQGSLADRGARLWSGHVAGFALASALLVVRNDLDVPHVVAPAYWASGGVLPVVALALPSVSTDLMDGVSALRPSRESTV